MARIQIQQPDSYAFATEIDIRITDTNYGGHMGNDSLLSMIHEARVRFLTSMGFSELDVGGLGIIMTDSAIQYRSEAFQGERLVFEVMADDLNKYGCDIVYRVTDKATGREVALAKTGIVFFDYQQRKVQPRPDCFDSALAQLDQPAAA